MCVFGLKSHFQKIFREIAAKINPRNPVIHGSQFNGFFFERAAFSVAVNDTSPAFMP